MQTMPFAVSVNVFEVESIANITIIPFIYFARKKHETTKVQRRVGIWGREVYEAREQELTPGEQLDLYSAPIPGGKLE